MDVKVNKHRQGFKRLRSLIVAALAVVLVEHQVPSFCGEICRRSFGRESCLPCRPLRHQIAMLAQGIGLQDTEVNTPEEQGGEPSMPADKDIEKPLFELPGPLRPPDAPATYKALTKIRLRIAGAKLADLSMDEIQKDAEFRVVEAKEADDVICLRTDPESEYKGLWLLDRGFVGMFRGKKVVKRIAGSLGSGKKAILHEISMADPAYVAEANSGVAVSEKERLRSALEGDRELSDMFEAMGIDTQEYLQDAGFKEFLSKQMSRDKDEVSQNSP